MPKTKREKLPFCLDPLDRRFVGPKPKNTVEESVVRRLEAEGRAIFARKEDGYGVFAVVHEGRARIYSRTIERDFSAHFPDIVRELSGLCPKGASALFASELIWRKNGLESREMVAKYIEMDADAAAVAQAEGGHAELMLYNALVWNGKDISGLTWRERIRIVQKIFVDSDARYIYPLQILDMPFDEAKQLILSIKGEGLVIYDATKPTEFRLDGKSDRPPRPNGCGKWKPYFEDDFIAVGFKYGTKNKAHEYRMGKLYIAQIHPRTGKLVSCGYVGKGFSNAQREQFAVLPQDGMLCSGVIRYQNPRVIQVKYQKRFKTSKALHAESFLCVRNDKRPEECLLPEEYL